jgi:hypothetical protein
MDHHPGRDPCMRQGMRQSCSALRQKVLDHEGDRQEFICMTASETSNLAVLFDADTAKHRQ